MILALDTATKTGWALMLNGKVYESGVQDFSKRRGESNGGLFLRFRHWLNQMVAQNDIKLIAYERAHHRGGAATELCVNLTGRVQECAAEHSIEVTTIPTMTLKKWATGKGNADKAMMMERTEKEIGRKCIDDNEADAILIGLWAVDEYGNI